MIGHMPPGLQFAGDSCNGIASADDRVQAQFLDKMRRVTLTLFAPGSV